MRENIGLYRGKRLDNGEWVEGAFSPKDCDMPFGPTVEKPSIIKLDEPFDGFWFDVDPETVGECSGIPDKNGKLIFEGDVLKVIYLCQKPVIARVTFRDGKYGIRYTRHGNTCIDTMSGSMSNLYEIIGNIYDNPELLGGDTR